MTEETPQLKKDVVPSEYRTRYKEHGGTTGDLVAVELQRVGKDGIPALQSVMVENEIPKNKWSHMNAGQQRMNLSNVLRSRLLNGDSITILGKQHNVRHMADDYGLDNIKDTDASVQKFAEKNNLLGSSPARVIKALRKTFFPPVSTKKTAAEKAAEKAERDKHKAEAKAQAKAAREAAKPAKATPAKPAASTKKVKQTEDA